MGSPHVPTCSPFSSRPAGLRLCCISIRHTPVVLVTPAFGVGGFPVHARSLLEMGVKSHGDLGHPACRHQLRFRWSAAERCLALALAHVGRCCWELVLREGETVLNAQQSV